MSLKDQSTNPVDTAIAAIAAGSAVSAPVSVGSFRLFGLVMPAAWTAAVITFLVSFDGGATWSNMYDKNGAEISVAAGVSRYIALDPAEFAAVPMIKLRSGTAAAPVNQVAAASISLILRSI